MIISRLIPPDSPRYQLARDFVSRFDKLFALSWNSFYIIWTLLLAGMGAAAAREDRYLYWVTTCDWRSLLFFLGVTLIVVGFYALKKADGKKTLAWIAALAGIVCLAVVNLILLAPMALTLVVMGPGLNFEPFDTSRPALKKFGLYALLFYLLFLMGWLYKDGALLAALLTGLPYVLGGLAVLLVFWIAMEPGVDGYLQFSEGAQRMQNLLLALVLSLAATALGYLNDDPVISTAACVYLPFLAVALVFPPHVRHIQRARIYPIFTLTMLVAVRYAWYLLSLAILWWTVRSYTYLRQGEPQPSFRVDYDQN